MLAWNAYAEPLNCDSGPISKTVPQAYYAGLNGCYPWFPTEASFLQGTQAAAQIAAAKAERRGGLLRRLIGGAHRR
jgi:hypothetical protein